jgi:hypothetical protein
MTNPYQSSGDVGSDGSPDLSAHITGNPFRSGVSGSVTVGHTWVIIVGAILILWLLGGGVFRKIRM